MGRRGILGAAALLVGCPLDTSGIDVPSNMVGSDGTTGASSESSTSPIDPTTTSATTDVAESFDDDGADTSTDPTHANDETTTTSGADESSTGPVDVCADPPPFVLQLPADEAMLIAPMILDAVADGSPYVVSEVESMGVATFSFDVPCPGEYYFHALVYDGDPGPVTLLLDDNGADSYAVEVEGQSATWQYGCQTGGILPPLWQWQPVMNNAGCILADDKVVAPLVAGAYTISFRNLETGTNAADTPGTAAAMAALVVTDDPDWVP
jgi:hypothetical protein